jgi:hypothetical protein
MEESIRRIADVAGHLNESLSGLQRAATVLVSVSDSCDAFSYWFEPEVSTVDTLNVCSQQARVCPTSFQS